MSQNAHNGLLLLPLGRFARIQLLFCKLVRCSFDYVGLAATMRPDDIHAPMPGKLLSEGQPFRNSGLEPPRATVVTVSLHLYMRLIETGRWLGLVPASVMRFGGQRMHLKVLSVKTVSPPAPVGLITVKGRTLIPLAERFIECARKVTRTDAGRASTRRA